MLPEQTQELSTIFGLTDLSQSDQASRNLFFAGVFAGILGGLAIEIIGTAYEVAEASEAKRKGRPKRPGKLKQWQVRLARWWRRRRQKKPEQLTLWD